MTDNLLYGNENLEWQKNLMDNLSTNTNLQTTLFKPERLSNSNEYQTTCDKTKVNFKQAPRNTTSKPVLHILHILRLVYTSGVSRHLRLVRRLNVIFMIKNVVSDFGTRRQ